MNITHLHPALVHFPIGIWIIAALLYFAQAKNIISINKESLRFVVGIGVAIAIPTLITGLWHSRQSQIELTDIILHIIFAASSLLFAVAIFLQHRKESHSKKITVSYIGLFVCTLVAGHFGGSITHGSNYLFETPSTVPQIKHINSPYTMHTVEIKGMKYIPQRLTINDGDSIIFINKDLVPHDVVSDTKNFKSPKISPRNEWKTSFISDINYHCSYHLSMTGQIRVINGK